MFADLDNLRDFSLKDLKPGDAILNAFPEAAANTMGVASILVRGGNE